MEGNVEEKGESKMKKQLSQLLTELSKEICVGCPKSGQCDLKITEPPECRKRDLLNQIGAICAHAE